MQRKNVILTDNKFLRMYNRFKKKQKLLTKIIEGIERAMVERISCLVV